MKMMRIFVLRIIIATAVFMEIVATTIGSVIACAKPKITTKPKKSDTTMQYPVKTLTAIIAVAKVIVQWKTSVVTIVSTISTILKMITMNWTVAVARTATGVTTQIAMKTTI
jgi:hypothetical protein